ncbi:hypothetical protein C0Q70_14235 [Pomacea canaliculata]|uniref:CxC1-like cysteine cluster associated with KDZ transposases domain-containing protein n=1 Tax=Pomacea canaliculata TaxID=400727 RepID=A0A2T7NZG7_POMCA|nr:hypothetical protein C0Q70_14235 [Pomacea canaliculata]
MSYFKIRQKKKSNRKDSEDLQHLTGRWVTLKENKGKKKVSAAPSQPDTVIAASSEQPIPTTSSIDVEPMAVDPRKWSKLLLEKRSKIVLTNGKRYATKLLVVHTELCAVSRPKPSDTVTLLRHRLWGSSPEIPSVAFKLDVMEWLRALVLECQVSVKGFVDALATRLSKIDSMSSKKVNGVYQALVAKEDIEVNAEDPATDGSQKVLSENNRIFSFDANFGLSRKKSSGKSPVPIFCVLYGHGHESSIYSTIASNNNKKVVFRKATEESWIKSTILLPIFHSFGHKMSCQLEYGPRSAAGIGLTDGETVERLWSYLRKFSGISKMMTPQRRVDLLTDALLHYASKLRKRLVSSNEKDKYMLTLFEMNKCQSASAASTGSDDSRTELSVLAAKVTRLENQYGFVRSSEDSSQYREQLTSAVVSKRKLVLEQMRSVAAERSYSLMQLAEARGQEVAKKMSTVVSRHNKRLKSLLTIYNKFSPVEGQETLPATLQFADVADRGSWLSDLMIRCTEEKGLLKKDAAAAHSWYQWKLRQCQEHLERLQSTTQYDRGCRALMFQHMVQLENMLNDLESLEFAELTALPKPASQFLSAHHDVLSVDTEVQELSELELEEVLCMLQQGDENPEEDSDNEDSENLDE